LIKVTCLFRIRPAAYFGVPEGTKVVVPANPAGAEVEGPVVDTRSGLLVTHGTLSSYRPEDRAISEELIIEDVTLKFQDDFVTTKSEAPSLGEGVKSAKRAIARLLRHLMVLQPDYFQGILVQYERDGGEVKLAPEPIPMMHCTFYNLDELRERLREAAFRSVTHDSRIDRALLYHEHARFLNSIRHDTAITFSPHARYLLASAYLHLWKAITVVLGEPGTDRDYQRRFRQLGLPPTYWKDEVAPLKKVRDDADVAHYQLDGQAIVRVEKALPNADRVCREVISQYLTHKRSN
jgi:hypothetical protein